MNSSSLFKTWRVGRVLRLALGGLILLIIAPVYFTTPLDFALISLGIALTLLLFYVGINWLILRFALNINPIAGALLANVPLLVVFLLGGRGEPIFGRGEGQVGALTYFSAALLVAGWRGDLGCEVMSLPGLISSRSTALPCLLFGPVDWIERKVRHDD